MPKTLNFPCIRVSQPIGSFFIGSIKAKDLCAITKYDFRRLSTEEGFASYLGIQRKVIPQRVAELSKYVTTLDACFPTAVILAIPGNFASFNEKESKLELTAGTDGSNEEDEFGRIAVVLDGQHRIAGLMSDGFDGEFEINVSIFIDIDIADQAYIFSTVNLAQTKVNKSLVYDLFDLAKSRSPQKTCHNIAVALDREESSPFFKKIKRLGVSTEGRFSETITQSTFVESLLPYISEDAIKDRDLLLRGKEPPMADVNQLRKLIFRNMFLEQKDLEIMDVVWNFFAAVKNRWPTAWDSTGRGKMLNKTNGFKALMRLMKLAYLNLTSPGVVPTSLEFGTLLERIDLTDEAFDSSIYLPGTSGEGKLFHELAEKASLA